MENSLQRMKELVEKLDQAAKAYYQEDREIMSNQEYDSLYDQLEQLEKEKGIPVDYMLDRVCQALLTAYKKDNDGLKCDNVYVEPDMDEKTIHMYASKEVVDEAEDPLTEISLEDAKKISPRVSLGDFVRVGIETKKFGRIAAQAAKQVIIQGIRESERGMAYNEYSSREHEILNATVFRVDPESGTIIVEVVSEG